MSDWIVVAIVALSIVALSSVYVRYILDPLVIADKLGTALIVTFVFICSASAGLVLLSFWLSTL